MRKSINLVLVLGMLSFSLHPAYCEVDKRLKDEITAEYQAFKGRTIPGIAHQPCLAIQFVYDLQEKLQETHDKHIAEKIAAIVSEGAGVGGIDNERQATEDERKVIWSALGNLYPYSDKKLSLILLPDEDLSPHQQSILEAMELISIHETFHHPYIKSYNFVQYTESFNNFDRVLKIKEKFNRTVSLEFLVSQPEDHAIFEYIYIKPALNLKNFNLRKFAAILLKPVDNEEEIESPLEKILYRSSLNIFEMIRSIDWALSNLSEEMTLNDKINTILRQTF